MLALTVVIDPGHGGSNTGAPGRKPGTYEKQVTMSVARLLKARLVEAGATVILTRDHDEYLTLRERSRRANSQASTCFVSLHGNASPDHSRRGAETYVLSREITEVEARRARMQSADPSGAQGLLAELAMIEAHRASVALAQLVHARLYDARGGARSVKQATYDVLSGQQSPAILVEIGFLDHPLEGAELLDPSTQAEVAQNIAAGLLEFAGQRPAARLAQLQIP